MDQGAAAVLAAAVAGFSSAAGAAVGAVLAGRSGRATVVQAAAEERGHRHEDRRSDSYAAFRTKVNAALEALDEIVQALRNEQTATGELAAKAVRDVWLSYYDDVWPCNQSEIINAAGEVHNCLVVAQQAVAELLARPEDAKDADSLRMQRWTHSLEEVGTAYRSFSTRVGEAIYPT
ncbi:hypothetical protein [Streptomyces sp. enrichment culture]|uniref:hypothetical protein n=1 Tax=Streptomyces sp. enrichment culture TaxID=1795815 RepID=UPI003F55400D